MILINKNLKFSEEERKEEGEKEEKSARKQGGGRVGVVGGVGNSESESASIVARVESVVELERSC